MSFKRLSLLLCLPLAILVWSQLGYLGGSFLPNDYLVLSEEIAAPINERDDKKSFNGALPVVIFDKNLIQHFYWTSLESRQVLQSDAFELHATGPPTT